MPQGNKACVQQPRSLQAATRDIHMLQMKTQLSQKERKGKKKKIHIQKRNSMNRQPEKNENQN